MNTYTVSQLNLYVRNLLENQVSQVKVTGEVSNLTRPTSGHYYFTLKDATAQVRCCFFRNRQNNESHSILKNGQKIEISGKPSLYEARGDYQLIIENVSDAGLGDLHRQFELLKERLAKSGIFDQVYKKPLPRFPQTIGIITSETGAAIRDILTTLARRYPVAKVIIYPTEVQGAQASTSIIRALKIAIDNNNCDVLILARGGGSIEDLWAFNDENLANTIAHCPIPIVSGVGHETDFTIADFVADLRAATPTGAAESCTPDIQDLLAWFNASLNRLNQAVIRIFQHKQLLLNHAIQKLSSPDKLIQAYWQTLDYLNNNLIMAMQKQIKNSQYKLSIAITKIHAQNPSLKVSQQKINIDTLSKQLNQLMRNKISSLQNQLRTQLSTLHAVSPLATLDRGYSIAKYKSHVLTHSQQVKPGDLINIRLAKGSLTCEVQQSVKTIAPQKRL